jgi:hypothetical protein
MIQKNKKSRKAIPGYTLIPKGDHYQVRKIGITSDRFKKDPAFDVTRAFANEFGKAAKMSKLIRDTFLSQLNLAHAHRLLTSKLVEVLRTDEVSNFGDRCFGEADFSPLTGFDFNPVQPFGLLVKQGLIVEHKVSEKQIQVTIPAFIPDEQITAPEGFSFFSFIVHCIGINGKEMRAALLQTKGRLLPLGPVKTPRKKLIFNMDAEHMTTYLVLASINFNNINLLKKLEYYGHKDLPLTVIEVIRPPR